MARQGNAPCSTESPLHHFNACRPKLVLAAGFAPGACARPPTRPLDVVSWWLPAKAWTTRADKWGLQPVVIRRGCFTKEIRRLLQGGNSDEFAGKQCYGPPGTMLDVSTEVTGARKAPVALTATAGYSQKPQHDEMEFADHHCRRPKRRVIHG